MYKHERVIGKGRQKDISRNPRIRMTLNMEDVEKFIYEFKGKKYITFDIEYVATLDRTHTAFAVTKNN